MAQLLGNAYLQESLVYHDCPTCPDKALYQAGFDTCAWHLEKEIPDITLPS